MSITHWPLVRSQPRAPYLSVLNSVDLECLSSKQEVGGSNPSEPAIKYPGGGIGRHASLRYWFLRVRVSPGAPSFFIPITQWTEFFGPNEAVASSNLARDTNLVDN